MIVRGGIIIMHVIVDKICVTSYERIQMRSSWCRFKAHSRCVVALRYSQCSRRKGRQCYCGTAVITNRLYATLPAREHG